MFDQTGREIEFLEQFNERIMIKTKNAELMIYDTWSNQKITVAGFEAPEAFIFLYEKEKFLTLKEGIIEIWTAQGDKITDFGGQVLCSKVEVSGDASEANYIVSVSSSKRYLFAFQTLKKQQLINVIDIQRESLVSSIRCRAGSKEITSLFFCEQSYMLFIGKQDGEVESYVTSTSGPSVEPVIVVPESEDERASLGVRISQYASELV